MANIGKVRNPLEVVKLEDIAISTEYTKIPIDESDERTAFTVYASEAANLTIAAGDGYAATTDEVIALPDVGSYAFYLDSARFKITSGADRGCVKIKSDKAVTMWIIALGTAATQEAPVVV